MPMAAPLLRPLVAAALALSVAGCTSSPTGGPSGGPADGPSRTTEPKAATPPQVPHSERPAPDPTTPAPAGGVTAAQLPRAADLQSLGGAWAEGETVSGNPALHFSACQRSSLAGTGATSVQARRFTGPGGATATAVVLGFPGADLAAQAGRTLGEWWHDCGEVVQSNGATEPRLVIDGAPVTLPSGGGTLTASQWTADGRQASEAQGVAVVGDRVAILVQSGTTAASPADHPVARTLPRIAERLRA